MDEMYGGEQQENSTDDGSDRVKKILRISVDYAASAKFANA
jgi:hypothetical protein